MKKETLVPVLTALLAFAVTAGVSSQAALDLSEPIPLVPDAPNVQGLVPQPEAPAGVMPATISGTLPLGALDARKVDVGIDFLVQQTTAAPAVENGVGLMLTFIGR